MAGPTPVTVKAPAAGAPYVADPDAPPDRPGLSYMPALDGVRAFAVLGVMAFHGGIPWLPAGFLGVDTFFVLSGFLITSLLITEWGRSGTVRLGRFWARRARRLLPALMLVIVFVVLYAAWVAPSGAYPGLRLDALSTLFYVANWHFILVGGNYFDQTGLPSLLTHTWSLAVEEQFYLVWPLVVLGVLTWTRRLGALLVVCVAGAAASATAMVVLFDHGTDLTRLYYGTDTHGQCLLVGAALATTLAVVARRRRERDGGDQGWTFSAGRARLVFGLAGAAGVVVTALLWWRVSYAGSFLWRGGFLVAAVSTVAVLACVVCVPTSLLARALSVRPLRFLGRISYGMYLWHFPLFQWIDGSRTGLGVYALFAVRCAATVAVSTASFFLVERPIRQRRLLRQWRAWVATPLAVVCVAGVVIAATSGSGALAASPATRLPASAGPRRTVLMLGDSTATTLGIGLSIDAAHYGARLVDKGILGCGVAQVADIETKGTPAPVAAPCNPSTAPADRWPALWTKWVDRYRPAVVVVLAGRWEVSTVRWRGRWTNIGTRRFADYVGARLRQAVAIAGSHGARVVLLTAPCYDSGEQPDGSGWPADSPARLADYNRLLETAARSGARHAAVVGLGALVCPGGSFASSLDGVTVRAPDGVHFPFFDPSDPSGADPDTVSTTERFGVWIGQRLWPQILAAP